MRPLVLYAAAALAAVAWGAAATPQTPVLFAAERDWPAGVDTAPAFTPDGRTVIFTHAEGERRTLMIATLGPAGWSQPRPAPFSGRWRDLEPAISPDGRYLVFVSNRPATPGGAMLTGYWGGQPHPGAGGNLWRVDRTNDGWSEPRRLPQAVNGSSAIYSPAVAADGSLYFNEPDRLTHKSRVFRAQARGEGYERPVMASFSAGAQTAYDVAVAPDESFVVFSSGRPPAPADQSLLFVAYRRAGGWSAAAPLGAGIAGLEARFSPDLRTLYFTPGKPEIPGADVSGRIHQLELKPLLDEPG
jgi:Tol biopolymer transport system component